MEVWMGVSVWVFSLRLPLGDGCGIDTEVVSGGRQSHLCILKPYLPKGDRARRQLLCERVKCNVGLPDLLLLLLLLWHHPTLPIPAHPPVSTGAPGWVERLPVTWQGWRHPVPANAQWQLCEGHGRRRQRRFGGQSAALAQSAGAPGQLPQGHTAIAHRDDHTQVSVTVHKLHPPQATPPSITHTLLKVCSSNEHILLSFIVCHLKDLVHHDTKGQVDIFGTGWGHGQAPLTTILLQSLRYSSSQGFPSLIQLCTLCLLGSPHVISWGY